MLDRKISQSSFLQDLLGSIAGRGRRLFEFLPSGPASDEELESLCEALLSSRGEASGAVLAESILHAYGERRMDARLWFFRMLAERFGVDAEAAVAAAEAYRDSPSPATMRSLQANVEPRRQELLRRLNLARGGTAAIVKMRTDLLEALPAEPALFEVDADFVHLFQSWFNRGFLEMRRIDWNTSAAVLDKIIHYEAVHEISDWDDLRSRIAPADRRLYAFFHPSLPQEPLIFVEVALTVDMPSRIDSILARDRDVIAPEQARTAVFYSISNCQEGLRGISFGSLLIKQVLDDLRAELPNLKAFATLSPLIGFSRWVREARDAGTLDAGVMETLTATDKPDWWLQSDAEMLLMPTLIRLAVEYLTTATNPNGTPRDSVARFHLGNGARLERINWPGDLSAGGISGALGVMVNYLYRVQDIEQNHEAFVNTGTIAVSPAVARLMRTQKPGGAA